MFKTKLLFLGLILLNMFLFFYIFPLRNQSLEENKVASSNIAQLIVSDFSSLWKKNQELEEKDFLEQKEQKMPKENVIIKNLLTKNKIAESLAIRISDPLDLEKLFWIKTINPALLILEASKSGCLLDMDSDFMIQDTTILALDCSQVSWGKLKQIDLNQIKKFDIIILPAMSYFFNNESSKNIPPDLINLINLLEKNQNLVLLNNYPQSFLSKSKQSSITLSNLEVDLYYQLLTQFPYLGLIVDDISLFNLDNDLSCLVNKSCANDEFLKGKLKISQNLFNLNWSANQFNQDLNQFCWQILKNSDTIYLSFDLNSSFDFIKIADLLEKMEEDYQKDEEIKTIVINNLKKLIKLKLDLGVVYEE